MRPKLVPLVAHRFSRLSAALLLICLVASPLAAQVDRASLNGTVTDPAGARVAGVKVEAISTDTGKQGEAVTNDAGVYAIPSLPVGRYTISFSSAGFQTLRYDGVELKVGETATLDARLQVGSVETRIEVQSTAPLLDRSTADTAGVVGRAAIENLPVNGRNWANLLVLAPGAIDDGGGNQRTIRFAGRARDDNNYMFDGVDATGIQEQAQKSTTRLQVSEDAIEEYRVNSALYSAEYGAGAGGQVDIVTKSGSNQLHGDVFEYLRNSALDSRSFLDIDTDPTVTGPTRVPPFRLNQFGGSIGGPIAKDKTFFFVNYEGLRQFRGQTLHAFVPSASLDAQILATSPQMAPIMQAFPAGQVSTCTFNPGPPCQNIDEYTHLGAVRIREDSTTFRVDHKFSDATQFYFRGVYDNSFSAAPLNNLFDQQQINTHPQNYALSLMHTFSPNVFNEVKFGLNRAPFHNPQVGAFSQNYSVSTDFFEGLNNNSTDHEVGTSFGYIDNLTLQHGRHTFKMGGEVRRIRLNQGQTQDYGLDFTGNGDANLINDQLNGFTLKSGWWSLGLRHTFILPYFQDQWKLRPNFTLNMGLRWEYYAPITESHGRSRIFDIRQCANAVPGDPGICPQGTPFFYPNYRNFDPRSSFAWSPTRFHDKTVIRAGYGIYSGAGQNDDLNSGLESNSDAISLTSSDVANLSYPIDPFIPLASTTGRTPRALDRHRRDIYAEEWGLSVQQSLPGDFVLQTGYFGTVGHRLFARNYINLCDNTVAERQAGICTRQLAGVGAVDIKYNDGNSTFNALQVSLQRHFRNGFMFATNYMWSHSINDGSIGGGESNAPENANCRLCDRGPSVYDIRHNLVVSSVYDLPFGAGKKFLNGDGLTGKLLGGWQLSGIQTFHTGHPLTVTVDRDSSTLLDGNSRSDQRPDFVPGAPLIPSNQGPNNWINETYLADGTPVSPFAVPADFTWGSAGRGLIRAPITWQTDVSLSKMAKISERFSLQISAQAFNVFNHDQFADPVVNISNGSFGQIVSTVNFNSNNDSFAPDNTGSGTPRQFQFSLRLVF
jgi:carboxypeptidase family protein/TonB-dependent receptor-like protein